MKIYNQARRTGKTENIISLVDYYTMSDQIPIWIVTPTHFIEERLRKRILCRYGTLKNMSNNIIFIWIPHHLRGISQPQIILVDEYNYCSGTLIDILKEQYSDRLIMFGTE